MGLSSSKVLLCAVVMTLMHHYTGQQLKFQTISNNSPVMWTCWCTLSVASSPVHYTVADAYKYNVYV